MLFGTCSLTHLRAGCHAGRHLEAAGGQQDIASRRTLDSSIPCGSYWFNAVVSKSIPITCTDWQVLAHHLATVIVRKHVDLDLVNETDDLDVMRSLRCNSVEIRSTT